MGVVFNIQKFCLHDGDGIRTVVFLKGCSLRCIWCHNPEGWKAEPELSFREGRCSVCGRCLDLCEARSLKDGAILIDRSACVRCGQCVLACLSGANKILGEEMTAEDVMKEVLKDRAFYDQSGGGLTLSGGEPAAQPAFTLELLRLAVKEGVSVLIETGGTGARAFYEEAATLGAGFLFDIKCLDDARHRKYCGEGNRRILSNLYALMKRQIPVVIRLPLVPGLNDTKEDMEALAAFLKQYEGQYRYAEIMPYHSLGAGKTGCLGGETSYLGADASEDDIKKWTDYFASCKINVRVSR